MQTFGKNGQGAFRIAVFEDGESKSGVDVSFCDGQDPLHFDSARAAYDYCRDVYDNTGDHAYWNACYHLQDFIAA